MDVGNGLGVGLEDTDDIGSTENRFNRIVIHTLFITPSRLIYWMDTERFAFAIDATTRSV
jgi:hypothetical protein